MTTKPAELDPLALYDLTSKAGLWVRQKYNVHPQCTIHAEFEREFNCKLVVDGDGDPWAPPQKIIFNTPEDLTLFVLRWSA